MPPMHVDEKSASSLEEGPEAEQRIDRVATVDVDNYHGVDIRTSLVFLVWKALRCLI